MKPEVLEYRGPLATGEKPRPWWRRRAAFPLALVSALISLIGSLFASWILRVACLYTGPNSVQSAVLTLFLVGIPLMFLLLVTSAVTIALAFGENNKPWGRGRLGLVVVPQVAGLLLPIVVMLVWGHPL